MQLTSLGAAGVIQEGIAVDPLLVWCGRSATTLMSILNLIAIQKSQSSLET